MANEHATNRQAALDAIDEMRKAYVKVRDDRDKLQEALEKIRSYITFDIRDSFPISEIDAIARDVLAGGHVQESCRTLSDELRNKIEKTMTDHWDMKACECLVCEAGRVLGCGPREWHQPHKQKHYVTKNPCDCYPSPENWGVCRDCGKDILDSGTET